MEAEAEKDASAFGLRNWHEARGPEDGPADLSAASGTAGARGPGADDRPAPRPARPGPGRFLDRAGPRPGPDAPRSGARRPDGACPDGRVRIPRAGPTRSRPGPGGYDHGPGDRPGLPLSAYPVRPRRSRAADGAGLRPVPGGEEPGAGRPPGRAPLRPDGPQPAQPAPRGDRRPVDPRHRQYGHRRPVGGRRARGDDAGPPADPAVPGRHPPPSRELRRPARADRPGPARGPGPVPGPEPRRPAPPQPASPRLARGTAGWARPDQAHRAARLSVVRLAHEGVVGDPDRLGGRPGGGAVAGEARPRPARDDRAPRGR